MDIYINIDDVASSNIKKIKYEAHCDNENMKYFNNIKGVLTIMYSNESIYNYLDVPISTIGNVITHDSVGKSVATLVKPNFESEKVGP
jgi:hypothetical protein